MFASRKGNKSSQFLVFRDGLISRRSVAGKLNGGGYRDRRKCSFRCCESVSWKDLKVNSIKSQFSCLINYILYLLRWNGIEIRYSTQFCDIVCRAGCGWRWRWIRLDRDNIQRDWSGKWSNLRETITTLLDQPSHLPLLLFPQLARRDE